VILLDTLLVGGLRFVLSQIVAAVDAELDSEARLREELLALQMRLELGEVAEAEYRAAEAELLRAIREARRRAGGDGAPGTGAARVAGIEATTWDQEPGPDSR
jgi:hypothetical protein